MAGRAGPALVQRESAGPVKIETVKIKDIRPTEALVEIHASGICHTDLGFLSGKLPFTALPGIFGHEGAGVVLETGSEVTAVGKGDKVLLSFLHCGDCKQCATGHPAYCYNFTPGNFFGRRSDGTTCYTLEDGSSDVHGHFFGQSSFARLAVVDRSSMVKVAPDAPLERFAPLGCGMITGAGTVINVLDLPAGSNIAVFGCGGVGMAAIMAAKIRGAATIIATDLIEDRLKLAKELGATHTFDGSVTGDALVEEIKKICPPMGVQYAVDATGVPSVIETMIKALDIRGKAATVGSPPPEENININPFTYLLSGKQYIGVTEGDSIPSKMVPYLIDEYNKGNFPIDKLITYYDVKEFDKAVQDMMTGKALKAVIKWS